MAGRISINGEIVRELGVKFDPERDKLALDGKPVKSKDTPPRIYWMLNKPDKILTSRQDPEGRETIFDLPSLKSVPFLFSTVGRLDFRTEGLLLISNDGELVHRLSHPSFKMPRHYQVLVNKRLEPQQEVAIRRGVELEDGKTQPANLKFVQGQNLGAGKGSWYVIEVREGKNRLVRRLFEHFDVKVVRLIRYGFGDLRLPDDLAPGQYRQLTSEQILDLKKATDLA